MLCADVGLAMLGSFDTCYAVTIWDCDECRSRCKAVDEFARFSERLNKHYAVTIIDHSELRRN